MLKIFDSLKNLIRTKTYRIDYPLFRLHYQATTSLLFAYCILLTTKVWFGDPIECTARLGKPSDFYDSLCYAQGTYTTHHISLNLLDRATNRSLGCSSHLEPSVPTSDASDVTAPLSNYSANFGNYLKLEFRTLYRNYIPKECYDPNVKYLFPGIPIPSGASGDSEDGTGHVRRDITWHRYYQYIHILLFLQALFFYLPHYLWKMWENGVVSSICKELYTNRFKPDGLMESSGHLIEYVQNCLRRNTTLMYKYYLCQILLLVNLIVQILVINYVLNYRFITYGIDAIAFLFDNELYGFKGHNPDQFNAATIDLNNPADLIFPKITACTIESLSQAGGELVTDQYICVLSLNIFSDKFYLALWFWFLILVTVTFCQLIFDLIYIAIPRLQRYLFDKKFGPYLSQKRRTSCSPSELFILDLIGCNSDKYAFAAFLKILDEQDCKRSQAAHSLV